MDPQLTNVHVACPRCGYDQRGVVETWKDSCPLEGVCSECGLTFAWPDLFRPERFAPQWCVEFTPRFIGLPWAAVRTAIRSCWPWHFWKRLRMSHGIRLRRIVAYLLLLCSPAIFIYVSAQATAAVIILQRYKAQLTQQRQTLPTIVQQIKSAPKNQLSYGGYVQGSEVITSLPSMRIVDEAYQESYRQRLLDQVNFLIAAPPPRVEYSIWKAMWEAIAFPVANTCSGQVWFFDPTSIDEFNNAIPISRPYQYPPSELWKALNSTSVFANPAASWWSFNDLKESLLATLGTAGVWTIMLLGPLPISLVLLPVTRNRAKVRWRHIGRVFLYSLSIPIVLSELFIALIIMQYAFNLASSTDEQTWGSVMALFMPIATIAWWWAAIKHYLRMPHALAVSIIMSVLCVLMIGAIIFVIGGTFFA